MKHIIVTIRYSLLMEKAKEAWKIGQGNSVEEYKKVLFSSERMAMREKVFTNITLKSLQKLHKNKPQNVAFKVHLLTSTELPLENINFLHKIVEENSFIDVKYHTPTGVSYSNDFNEYLDSNVRLGEQYASVRLDDDDALSINWLEKMVELMEPAYNNTVISLCSGSAVLLDTNGFPMKIAKMKWRFLAAGLAYISAKKSSLNLNIYQCGSHTQTDDKYTTILDATGNYYMRSYNNYNDSKDPFPKTSELDSLETSSVLKLFL